MANRRTKKKAPLCRSCGRRLRGQYRKAGCCHLCSRQLGLRLQREIAPRPPDLEERIKYYQARAALGLPLFPWPGPQNLD